MSKCAQISTTDNGLKFIAAWEGGVQTKVYRDSAGYRTIGVGHLIMDYETFEDDKEYPESVLLDIFKFDDLVEAEDGVVTYVKTLLTPEQFDALVSFTFNLGVGNFRKSTLLRKINARMFDEVPYQLSRWRKAGGKVVRGLERRRAAEAKLFCDGAYTGP